MELHLLHFAQQVHVCALDEQKYRYPVLPPDNIIFSILS